ncbi:UDP-glycosyltransferase 86A1 [Morus notabilis]|uniref:UDP-glycosyltransferase 86A1 n=1 Tax=Morus notabilis TaxID=981085 RepID=W9S505_9ROSA|nr:UDP-glycosyltransferase 86A1 [Morus notabilis]
MEIEDIPTPPKPHAIIIAFGLQGHVIPAVHLAIKLASKGLTITFVNTEVIHHEITKSKRHEVGSDDHQNDIFAGARNSGLDIRYRTVCNGFPIEFNRPANLEKFHEGYLNNLPNYMDELVGDILRDVTSVSCLIVDTFYTWTSQIAKKYNLAPFISLLRV